MAYKIEIAEPALSDAKEYSKFIRDARESPAAAAIWLSGLQFAISQLSDLPNRFSVIPEAEELALPFRQFVYHSHGVIYEVLEAEKKVVVHRVWLSARHPISRNEI